MFGPARRLLIPTAVLLLLVCVGIAASHYTSIEMLVESDATLRQAIRSRPVISCVIGFLAYVLVSLIPGTAGKSIILGWFFGLLAGVVIVNGALVLAAIITFVVVRTSFRELVRSRLGKQLKPFRDRMAHDGAFYLITLRMAHAPFTFMNYTVAAGTDVRLRTFWWTTQLGLLPGNIVFVFAGTRLPTLQELIQSGPLGVLDVPMLLALLSTVFVPWMVRKVFHLVIPKQKPAQQLR
jgi:uncharacterized membrane protein YdjX (TVP38/TMEM64 family)